MGRRHKAWHLLLEDLTNSHLSSRQLAAAADAGAKREICAARARFHAAWWDDPRLGLGWHLAGAAATRHSGIRAEFALCRSRRRPPVRRAARSLRAVDRRAPSEHALPHPPQHNPRPWRRACLERFPATRRRRRVRLFDWDGWRIDVATDDLAYMMALHWYPDHRRAMERQLLDHYHATLLAQRGGDYDRQALDDDYRLSVLWQITIPVWQAATTSRRGSGGPTWSASFWRSTISAVAICSADAIAPGWTMTLVYLVAGEASGDVLGARLMAALRRAAAGSRNSPASAASAWRSRAWRACSRCASSR